MADPHEIVCPCGGPPCQCPPGHGGCYAKTRMEWKLDALQSHSPNRGNNDDRPASDGQSGG
jgi:hypothetical protein